MNRFSFALCITIWIAIIPLSATNQLDIMHIIQGEVNGSLMGSDLAALDFNGDGLQDLAVMQGNWSRPEDQGVHYYGRILFYWGSDNFDVSPDLIIEGNIDEAFDGRMYKAGDVNGDGYDDLVCQKVIGEYPHRIMRLSIYYGGENPSINPGFYIDYPSYDSDWVAGVRSYSPHVLGDINGDGYDDIGIVYAWASPERRVINVLFGGTFSIYTVYDTYFDVNSIPAINGVGDVNSDGYADFVIGHSNFNNIFNNSVIFHYGSPNIAEGDSLFLVENSTQEKYMKPIAAGDVNGDGFADFLGRAIWDGTSEYGMLWLGGASITSLYDVQLSPAYFGTGWPDYCLIHGDLNGDGYDDLVGSDHEHFGDDGHVAIWLGKYHSNGIADLYLRSPDSIPHYSRFGYALAAGDFNCDGICDLAVGAPQSPPGLSAIPGAVVIYYGNAQLADTTVANADEIAPFIADLWKLSLSPNPVHPGGGLMLNYLGEAYRKIMTKTISIYNLKGQKVYEVRDTFNAKEYKVMLPKLPNGVYFIAVSDGDKTIKTQRIVITK